MVQNKKITVWKEKPLGLEKLQRKEQTDLEGSGEQEQKYIAREKRGEEADQQCRIDAVCWGVKEVTKDR